MTDRSPAAPPHASARSADAPDVSLRVVSARDAVVLSRLLRENRTYLLSGGPARTDQWLSVAGQAQRIRHDREELRADRRVPLVIVADGEVVGEITLSDVVRRSMQSASVGYWVSEHARGRGIATAALRALVDVAFGPMNLHRLEASAAVGNEASVRVLLRCGFEEIGLAPKLLRFSDGWTDMRLFQRINDAWREPVAGGGGDGAGGGTGGDGEASTESLAVGTEAPAGDASSDPFLSDPVPSERRDQPTVDVTAEIPDLDEVLALYDAVGWTAYTRDPGALARGLDGSAHVVAARDADGRLVGLARVVGDGATIAYLQDVLVDPSVQRSGIGRALVTSAFAPFAGVRQHVLLTDAEAGQRGFYEALGFTEVHDHEPALRAFVRTGG
ncbi:GNAT family N-acetyltransferase [Brachybacterium huguangmaarense]